MDRQRLIYLIKKRQQGKCSAAENAELHELMQNPRIEKEILLLWDQLHEEKTLKVSADDSKKLYDRIRSNPEVAAVIRNRSVGKAKKQRQWRYQNIVAAAAVLAIFLGIYFILFQSNFELEERSLKTADTYPTVHPGSNKAKIVFGDGTYQELGSNPETASINKDNFFTVNDKNGGVSYLESSTINYEVAEMHTLITPRGGEYAIQLADGTKIWLNANSSLKYPVSFKGASVREVELEGEAYFDVAKSTVGNKPIPFLVKSEGQVLEVLGTEFNINTFRNKVTTTLIEGSVKVAFEGKSTDQFYILQPNDQSVYDKKLEKINVAQIDPYYVKAWKSGDFAFDNAPLANVMDDIARWYDVDVEYKTEVNDVRFSGKVSKFENIETLLQTIEWTGSVKLKLNGRRITVMK
ncbi:FecR family protein [Sphingobacterium gobiense]|uniref:Anti-sigma factor n=1 Tax=Sphingobacterium gobiense TaxID=1382456 RepID=A0A2S9JRM9_9SPHI|nr:FecR family protein [Sphingobacterium gobiense]PRD55942.1 hypothetical protein C5749_01220 [Sphingobacterium gobiense]